jgi:hypothetical protein
MLQKYQEAYVNLLGIFLKVFWTNNARKLLILTKTRKKKPYIFFIKIYHAKMLEKHLKIIKKS